MGCILILLQRAAHDLKQSRVTLMAREQTASVSADISSKALLAQVHRICQQLAPHGWRELFSAHGLNIEASELEAELLRPLSQIDRSLDGFQDFCQEGYRGIEPGKPSQSLLFHALALAAGHERRE
jgi:hypothetical protein